MQDLLASLFFDIPVARWLTAAAVTGGAIVLALLVRWIATAVVARNHSEDGPPPRVIFALRMVKSFIFPALILGGLYLAVDALDYSGDGASIVSAIFVVLFSFVAIRFFVAVVNELFRRASADTRRIDLSRVRPLRAVAVFAIWIAGLLFLLDNLGFDITAVVAGLGIGGIAVALAAQALLGDLFSYFVILLDRPFEIGDFLIFGDVLGSVERIGVKTTRLRSLGGEAIVVSNSDLTSSRVRNYKHMQERRVVFRVGVAYGTPLASLREIPELIESIVGREESARFDRAHFASYGDWSLAFEVVYYVLTPDYTVYMDVQQRINFALYEAFEERGISFAFPTQTIRLERERLGDDASNHYS